MKSVLHVVFISRSVVDCLIWESLFQCCISS